MAIPNNHKMALLYMMRELLMKTDETHPLNASQLIAILHGYGCDADRRTIYSNIEILSSFGFDILLKGGNAGGYYIGARDFELPELKLLVDAVQASKFITAKKSGELIRKLEKLTNEQKARELNRALFIRGRMKAGNETIYYNVDGLHEAMNGDLQIRFQYAEWTPAGKLVPKRGGDYYTVSPWALTWSDENYYLIGFDEQDCRIKHFRVDKMLKLSCTDEHRNGRESFKDFDLAAFSKKTFGMYGGPDESVLLRCENRFAGVILDRFGRDILMSPDGPDHFLLRVTVSVSPQFFGWITGIGPGLEIREPERVRSDYAAYLSGITERYQ